MSWPGKTAIAIAAALIAYAAYAQDTFAVGSAVAQRGTIAYGTLDVPAGPDAATSIPVIVIHGARN